MIEYTYFNMSIFQKLNIKVLLLRIIITLNKLKSTLSKNIMESYSEKKIGKYAIYRTLGRGGTCKVKLGRDTTTNQPVAVKIMNDDLDAEDLQLVLTEVEAIKSVGHRNVIEIVECGEADYEKPKGSKRVNYIIV